MKFGATRFQKDSIIHSVITFGDSCLRNYSTGKRLFEYLLCLFCVLNIIFPTFSTFLINNKAKKDCYFTTTHPEVVGELQGENGNALIIERAGHGAGDVAGYDGDETCRQQPRTLIPQLSCQQEGGDGGQAAEDGRQEHANVSDVNGHMEQIQYVVNQTRRHHQTRIHLQ